MSALPTVYLARHGETEWSKSGQHTGRTDIPLTPKGERQATELRQVLAGRQFSWVLCSPLARARETCRLAGYGDVASLSEDLLEWDYGIYEGKTTQEIREKQPDWSIWTTSSGSMTNMAMMSETKYCEISQS